jgi:hypothetical protein
MEWAAARGLKYEPMEATYRHPELPYEWRKWALTRPGVCNDRDLRLFACRCVRETPLADGRQVWDLLTDPRSRAAVEVAERYARGDEAELSAARDAAWDASDVHTSWMLELPVRFEDQRA